MTLPVDPEKREKYILDIAERFKGIPRSEAVKKKISESLKGRVGRKPSAEEIEKRASKMRGRVFSEEHKKKLSDAKKGKPSSFKGKHQPESAKQKLRESNSGRKQSPETVEKRVSKMRGENHWNYGKHWDQETIEKISQSHIGINAGEKNYFFGKSFSGKDHPNWQGGISFYPYCEKFDEPFKERVRAFFGNCCIECGEPALSEKHHVHHCNFDKMSCCDDSLPLFVPLCRSCHAKTNYNRDYWEKRFTNIINQYYGGKCYFTKEEMQAIRACS